MSNDKRREILERLINPEAADKTTFNLDKDYQRCILGMLLTDRQFLTESMDLIKPTYFSDKSHQLISRVLFNHFQEYGSIPNSIIIKQGLLDKLKDEVKTLEYAAELNSLYNYFTPGLENRLALQNRILKFAKTEALRVAFRKSFDILERNFEDDESWDKIYEIYREAVTIDRNFSPGLDYFNEVDERYDRAEKLINDMDVFTLGFESLDNSLSLGGAVRGEIWSVMGLPGTGKTTIKDTPVLMYDGTIKKCQDVKVGDLVMGDDSKPRKVLATHSLVDKIYEVKPVKGESYFVNSKHILSLKNSHKVSQIRRDKGARTNNKEYRNPNKNFYNHPARMGDTDIYNISVEDWFKQSDHFKTKMKGWRTGVEFNYKEVLIDPYILGAWLGDGTEINCSFTNQDESVIGAVYAEADNRDMMVYEKPKSITMAITSVENSESIKNNSLYNDLKHYNLIKNKHIPFDYKVNDRETRLQVLAGLIDTDGELSGNGYSITQKRKTLAEDIVFLARSLGLAAYIKPCMKKCQTGKEGKYWRVSISGDCSTVPVRMHQKKAGPRKQIKDVLVTGIEVIETDNYGEFYGFEVDGNHLFLLGDFTVTHNSLALASSAVGNLIRGHKVLYITCEMSEDKVAQRFDAQLANVPIWNLQENRGIVKDALIEHVSGMEDKRQFVIKQFPAGTADVNALRAYYQQLKMMGFAPDMVIVDYVGEMKDSPDVKTYESRFRIVRDLRGWATEDNFFCYTAMQPNRGARELQDNPMQFIDDDNLADAFGQTRPLDGLWSINQGKMESEACVVRGFVIKSRSGNSRNYFYFEKNKRTLRLSEITLETYKAKMSLASGKTEKQVADHFDDTSKFENEEDS